MRCSCQQKTSSFHVPPTGSDTRSITSGATSQTRLSLYDQVTFGTSEEHVLGVGMIPEKCQHWGPRKGDSWDCPSLPVCSAAALETAVPDAQIPLTKTLSHPAVSMSPRTPQGDVGTLRGSRQVTHASKRAYALARHVPTLPVCHP